MVEVEVEVVVEVHFCDTIKLELIECVSLNTQVSDDYLRLSEEKLSRSLSLSHQDIF